MSQEPVNLNRDIADRNIERLLEEAYQPEELDATWTSRVRASLEAAAARRRTAARTTPVDEFGVPQGWPPLMTQYVGWSVAAALLMALLFIWNTSHNESPVALSNRASDGLGQPVAVRPAAVNPFPLLDRSKEQRRWLSALRRPAPPAAIVTPVGQTLATGPRERRRVSLADGSVVYLNENTTLRTLADRHVALDAGEIYLDVAPRTEHIVTAGQSPTPASEGTFVVETPKRRLTALGTKFAVTVAQKRTDVAVVQGRVRADNLHEPIRAGQRASLSATEKEATELNVAPRVAELLYWTRDLMAAAEPALVPTSSFAGGAVTVKSPNGTEVPLSLRRYHVDVHIEDGFARTTIDQTYFNHLTRREEGTFHFPLPPDASISRLAMYVNGKLMEGGMVERNRGRDVFESIKYRMQDPALLEWVDGTTFKMRVFPLEPREEKRIVLSYTQPLETLSGQTCYRFPIGHSLGDVAQFSAHLLIRGGAGQAWNCGSHPLVAKRQGADLVLDYATQRQGPSAADLPAKGRTQLAGELELTLTESSSAATAAPRFSSFIHEGYRYLMLRANPELTTGNRPQRRDWIFVVEASADRSPLLARAQIEIVRGILSAAGHDDTLAMVSANTRATVLSDKSLTNTAANVEAVCDQLDQVHLIGALDLEAALTAAGTLAKRSPAPVIVHIGSGVAALGERSDPKLAAIIPSQAQYIGIAVGRSFNQSLMKLAAAGHRGYVTQINPNESLAWRATDLVTTLNSPRLWEVKATTTNAALWLIAADSLTHGETLWAMTRVPAGQPLPRSVTLSGQLDGTTWKREIPVTSVADGAGYLPRQWARLEIDRLLAAGGEKNHDEIVTLSKAMYVMSPYTSLLVLENEAMYEQYNVDRGRKDHWAMYPAPAEIPVVREPLQGDQTGGTDLAAQMTGVEALQTAALQISMSQVCGATDMNRALQSIQVEMSTNPEHANRKLQLMLDTVRSAEGVAASVKSEWIDKLGRYLREPGRLAADVAQFRRPLEELRETMVVRSSLAGGTAQGFQPQISILPPGATLGPSADTSTDRRYVRITALPFFSPIGSTATFQSFPSGGIGLDDNGNGVVDFAPLLVSENLAFHNIRIHDTTFNGLGHGYQRSPGRINLNLIDHSLSMLLTENADLRDWSYQDGFNDDTDDVLAFTTHADPSGVTGLTICDPSIQVSTGGRLEAALSSFDATFDAPPRDSDLYWRGHMEVPDGTTVQLPTFHYFENLTDPPIAYPSAEIWRELSVRRRKYARTDLQTIIQEVEEEKLGLISDADRNENDQSKSVWGDGQDIRKPLAASLVRELDGQFQLGSYSLTDLLAYAPGMATNGLDLQAVLETEGNEPLPPAGHIDPKAAELIAKARAAGWRSVELGEGDQKLTIRFDGTGRFQYARATADGLKELVQCDGANLWHVYPELGVAAQRKFSRIYRGALCRMLPWLLPPAEDLALGADVAAMDDHTVTISSAGVAAQKTGTGKPVHYLQMRLVFAESGQVQRQQLVEMPTGKVLASVRLAADGSISLHDSQDKQVTRRALKLALAGAPDVTPPNNPFVIVPLPLRTQAEIAAKAGIKPDSDPATWDEATAISTAAVVDGPAARKIIQKRFFARGDFRLGFYTLLLRHDGAMNFSGQPGGNDEKCLRHPLLVDPHSPLARYIADRIGSDATTRPADAQPSLGDGLLAELDQYGALVTPLTRYGKLAPAEQKAQFDILLRTANDFVRRAHAPRLALHIGLLAERSLQHRDVHMTLADYWERMSKRSGAGPGMRYEQARQLYRAGQLPAARAAFLAYHRGALDGGYLPPIDREFYNSLACDDQGNRTADLWQKLIDETAVTLQKRAGSAALIPLAWQCRLMQEDAQADMLIEKALQAKDEKLPRQQITLQWAADYYHRTRQLDKADALVIRAIRAERDRVSSPLARSTLAEARLWHWAAEIADQRGRLAEAASREHQMLDLVYGTPPDKIDLNLLRAHYHALLARYQKLVDATALPGQEPPRELVSAIMAAADQWRNLDDSPDAACQSAARLLRTLGAKDAAWQYLTTPLAGKAHESAPWITMASQLAGDGEIDLAEAGYRAAWLCEPTNPEILLTHANLLRDQDRGDEARALYRQIVTGTWQQPRFNGAKLQAQQALELLGKKK